MTVTLAVVEGSTPPPFWATHQRLKLLYAEAYAALDGEPRAEPRAGVSPPAVPPGVGRGPPRADRSV